MDFNGLCQPDICLNIYVIAGINKNCLQLNCISHFFKSKINVKVVKLSDKLISGGQIHCAEGATAADGCMTKVLETKVRVEE